MMLKLGSTPWNKFLLALTKVTYSLIQVGHALSEHREEVSTLDKNKNWNPELSGPISICFNANSFAQFGINANSSLVWMGL